MSKDSVLPSEHTDIIYLYALWNDYDKTFRIAISDNPNMHKYSDRWVFLKAIPITIQVPPMSYQDGVLKRLERMEEDRQKVLAEQYKELSEIDQSIAELRALTYSPEEP